MKTHLYSLRLVLLVLFASFSVKGWGQTNPSPFDLAGGNYTFTGFSVGTTTAYPTSMRGWSFSAEPINTTVGIANADFALSNNSASATSSNIKNELADGISLLNNSSNNIGAIVVALKTTNRKNITLSWSAEDITATNPTRTNGLKLQYRIGKSGNFTDVTSSIYLSNPSGVKAKQNFNNIVLPSAADNQAEVQVRWIYYSESGSGNRDRLRLDDITISSSANVTTPSVTVAPTTLTALDYVVGNGPSPVKTFTITGANLQPQSGNNNIYIQAPTINGSNFEIDLGDGSGYEDFGYFSFTGSSFTKTISVRLKAGKSIAPYNDIFSVDYYNDANSPFNITQNVNVSGEVTGAKLIASPATLSGFTYIYGNGPSTPVQSFTLTGVGLSGTGSASLLPGDHWEISSDNGVSWHSYADNGIILNNYTGTSQTIQVRLKAGLAVGSYNNASNDIVAITYSVNGVTSNNVSLSGSVTAPVPTSSLVADGANSYTYVEGNGPSPERSYHVSGDNLTSNMTLSAPTNYEVSLTSGTGYQSTLSFVPTSGSVTSTKVFVRLKAGLTANTYNANLVLSATGISPDKSIALTGSVTIPVPSNDLCGNPTTLTVNAAATNGTMRGATRTSPFTSSDGINDVWYKFVVSHNADYTISVGGFTGDLDLYGTQCPTSTTGIAYAFTADNPEILTRNLSAGTYYIRVSSADTAGSTSPFTISVTSPKAITSDKTSLSFGNVNKNNSSSAQSFNASATYLDANASVAVTAPTNYELSLTNTANDWHPSLTLTAAADGFLASTQVFVRFNSTNVCGTSNDKIILSSTGVNNVEIAVTANAIVPATTAHTVTTATGTGFTATWDAVTSATGYKVNVYKNTTGTSIITEDFEAVAFPPQGWLSTGWSRATLVAEVPNGSVGAANANSNNGTLTTKLISHPKSISFYLGRSGNGTAKTLKVEASTTSQTTGFSTLATYDHNNTPSNSYNPYTIDLSAFSNSENVYIRFVKTSSTTSPWRLDDISFEVNSIVKSPVTGSPFTVSATATSYVVNGLESNTDYFYTVTALVDNCSSLESNEIAVTTTDKVIWNAGKWDNEIGPNENVNAEIASAYAEQADIKTKNLSITSGSLDVQANHSVTVHGALSQTTGNQITVESDASLVQVVGSTHDDKSITVKRDAVVPSTQYNIWSSPVKAQKLYDLYGTPGSVPAGTVMEYITKSDNFKPILDLNVTSVFAKGYSAKGLADNASGAVTAVFKGAPNNGAETIDLSVEGNRFNAVGNPYPSNLDLNKLYADNTSSNVSGIKNITNLVRFWDNTNNNITWQQGSSYSGNNYAIYNLDAALGLPATGAASGGDPTKIPDGIVKPGQGFMVRANTSGDKVLKFNNGQRLASAHANTPYYKNSSNKDRFWLALETPGAIVNTIAIAYNDLATNNNDIYDTSILDANNSDLFYSLSDNQYKQAIQSRKGGFVDTDAVKLGAKYYKAGTHKIKVIKKDGVFEGGQNIYLHDKVLNKYIDLATEAYSFDASASSNDTRFEIVYKPGAVLGAVDTQSKDAVIVYKTGDAFVVLSKADAITKVELYDMNGRLIQVNDKAAKEQKLSHETLSNGAYLLKISRGQNVVVKKVLK